MELKSSINENASSIHENASTKERASRNDEKKMHNVLKQSLATVHALSHDGRGIASVQNKTVFIDNALPEETVSFAYIKKSRRYDEAKAIEIIEASEHRCVPRCAHFNLCGGCALQHLESESQIFHKEKVLLEHLTHFGKVTPEKILKPIKGSEFGYRRKARLGVRYVPKKGGILVGFREKHSNKLAELNQCEILHPSVGTRIAALKALIQSLEGYQSIPQIEVAVGDKETALVFRHMEALSSTDQQKLINFSEETGILVYLQPQGPDTIALLWPKREHDYLEYALPEYKVTFHFKPDDFTQVNAEINQLMVKQALDLLQPTKEETILDLFCGLGNFTLPLARFAKYVIGIEGSCKMTERATANAKINALSNVEFNSANLEEGLGDAIFNKINNLDIGKVLLDPPRTGAQKIAMELSEQQKIQKIVYVSCNPATLARDVGILVHKGEFHLKRVQCLDMFPHTAHVESIALLER